MLMKRIHIQCSIILMITCSLLVRAMVLLRITDIETEELSLLGEVHPSGREHNAVSIDELNSI